MIKSAGIFRFSGTRIIPVAHHLITADLAHVKRKRRALCTINKQVIFALGGLDKIGAVSRFCNQGLVWNPVKNRTGKDTTEAEEAAYKQLFKNALKL